MGVRQATAFAIAAEYLRLVSANAEHNISFNASPLTSSVSQLLDRAIPRPMPCSRLVDPLNDQCGLEFSVPVKGRMADVG
jgi:hypothetical protein